MSLSFPQLFPLLPLSPLITFVTATVFGDPPLVSQVEPTCRLLDRGEAEERVMIAMNGTTVALEKNMIVECRLILNEKMRGGDSDD
jgi:hypothetical protein